MKITNIYDSLITEGESKKTKYGCVMLYLEPTDELISLQDKIDDDDVFHEMIDGEDDYGRTLKNKYHVTVLYGLHEEVTDEDVKDVLASESIPEINLKNISIFENDKFDVVKIDVESEGLNKLNKKLSEYPHTTDYPDYHAHMTIAYVKKGEGKKYIETLKDLEATPKKFVYSKINGDKVSIPLSISKS